MPTSPKPFQPDLSTERLLLRPMEPGDAPEVYFMRTDPHVNQFIDRKSPANLEEVRAFIQKVIEGPNLMWSITLKGQPKMIGSISLWNFSEDRKVVELGYALHPDHQGKGIMSETLRAVLDFGFESLQVDSIEAFTQVGNAPSRKLLDRHGFALQADREDPGFPLNLIYTRQKPG